jgi:hypothetical protein
MVASTLQLASITLLETHGVPVGATRVTSTLLLLMAQAFLMAQASVVSKCSLLIPTSELLSYNFIHGTNNIIYYIIFYITCIQREKH